VRRTALDGSTRSQSRNAERRKNQIKNQNNQKQQRNIKFLIKRKRENDRQIADVKKKKKEKPGWTSRVVFKEEALDSLAVNSKKMKKKKKKKDSSRGYDNNSNNNQGVPLSYTQRREKKNSHEH
jgi:hypothetical protein